MDAGDTRLVVHTSGVTGVPTPTQRADRGAEVEVAQGLLELHDLGLDDQLGALGRRQSRGGFIEQNESWRTGKRKCDLELALLAMRELGNALILHAREMDGLHEIFGRMHQRIVRTGPEKREASP